MGAIGSRSYESPAGAVLVPFADLLNDSPWPNAKWRFGRKSSYEIEVTSRIAVGQEILISYGKKDNDQLLTHYGFVHPGNARGAYYVDLTNHSEADVLAASPRSIRLTLSFDAGVTPRCLPRAIDDLRLYLETHPADIPGWRGNVIGNGHNFSIAV